MSAPDDAEGEAHELTEVERILLESYVHPDGGQDLMLIFLLNETIGRLTGGVSPLILNHVRQRIRAELVLLAWGFATCGIGALVLLPSYHRWEMKARLAARAGRMIQPW